MQKRLFGILASIAVIAAACGGATTSPSAPPPASVAPGQSAAPVATPAPSVSDLADEQILHIDLGQEPPTLDPNKAQDSTSIAVLHALHRGLVYFDKDLKVVPALAAELPTVSADAKTLTFTLKEGLKYSNGDPIVAGDFVFGIKRTLDPRTAAPYAYVLCEIAGADALLGAANGCGDEEAPTADADIVAALEKLGVTAPDDKTVVVAAVQAGHLLHQRPGAVDRGPGPGEVDHQRERDRGGELRRLRPVHPRHLGPQQPDHPQAESELDRRRQADPDRDHHVDDDRTGPGPGGVRGR